MSEVQLKYQKLDPFAQKEVDDFIDFLLSKKNERKVDMKSYQEKLLTVSTWSEDDIKVFEENAKLFNNWTIEEW